MAQWTPLLAVLRLPFFLLLPGWLVCGGLLAQAPAQLDVLLVTGANNHDWRTTSVEIAAALQETDRFRVRVTTEPARELAELDLAAVRAIVLDYNGPRWGDAAERAFLAAVEAGTGVVVVHAANNAFPGWTEYERLVGLCWRDGTGHGVYHPYDVYVVDAAHPVTAGMDDLRQHPDELYHRLVPTPGAEFRVLLSAFSDPARGGTGRFEPMATAAHYGKGRVFHTPLGHTMDNLPTRATWHDPQLRRLLARGTEWAATGSVTLDPAPLNRLSEKDRAEGFELLFDGRSLAGWRGYAQEGPPAQGWSAQGGALVHAAGGGGGDLVTVARYADFDLRFQFRVAPNANSGVLWRVQEDPKAPSYYSGPEYQVLDDLGAKPDPRHGSGALYDMVGNAGAPLLPAGRWNEGRIVLQKGRVQHWLNGKQLLDVACEGEEWQQRIAASKFKDWPFGRAAEGHLALQDHGDEVAFRHLRIRRL